MSSNDILTPDERDALLEGVAVSGVEPDPSAFVPSGEVHVHEFATQDNLAKGKLRTLESIHERFSRHLGTSLFQLIRRPTQVTAGDLQTLSYAEYIGGQPDSSTTTLVGIAPLEGTACFTLDAALVFALVESFFGGAGRDAAAARGREFTATELRVVRRVLGLAFIDLQKVCKAVVSIDLECSENQSNPLFASLASSNEVVVVTTFRIEFEGRGGDLQIAMPYSMVESLDADSEATGRGSQGEIECAWLGHMRNRIEAARVKVSSALTEADITVGELIELKPGDVIPVEMRDAVCATVEGVPVFRGKFGVSRGSLALQVVDAPQTKQFENPNVEEPDG